MTTKLEATSLSKKFGKKVVLDDISFTIGEGKIVGLVGPNGAGKTTIMKIILGLIDFDNGEVTIDGSKVSISSHQALGKVGALIEYPGIYPFLTGYDHLRLFSANKDTESIEHVISELKMTTYIKRKAKSYSLGMKQKLGIALAILNQPELVILDEPMNGLDPQATRDVRELIIGLAKSGTSFLISSHILGELSKVTDEMIIIDKGKIIKQVKMSDLSADSAHYLVIKTSDDAAAKALLLEEGYELAKDPEALASIKIKKTSDSILTEVVQLLSQKNIQLQDVDHQDEDLESILLELLSDSKGEA